MNSDTQVKCHVHACAIQSCFVSKISAWSVNEWFSETVNGRHCEERKHMQRGSRVSSRPRRLDPFAAAVVATSPVAVECSASGPVSAHTLSLQIGRGRRYRTGRTQWLQPEPAVPLIHKGPETGPVGVLSDEPPSVHRADPSFESTTSDKQCEPRPLRVKDTELWSIARVIDCTPGPCFHSGPHAHRPAVLQ
jgi:hypothetical protein